MEARIGCPAILVLLLAGCTATDHRVDGRIVALDDLLDRESKGRVQISLLVVSLSSGKVVFARDERKLLHPASTLKLVTTATALALGHHERDVATRVLRGAASSIGLIGGGDPYLSSEDLDALARRVAARHPRAALELDVDAGLFSGPRFGVGWMWDDEPAPFMPHLSALTVDEGCVTVVVDPLRHPPVHVLWPSAHVSVSDATRSGAGPLRITRDWESRGQTVRVTGELPKERTQQRVTVPRPALHAGAVFAESLMAAGWSKRPRLSERTGFSGHEVARHTRSMREVIHRLTKDSDNLAAECLLRHLGAADGAPGTAESGLARVKEYIRSLGLEPRAYRIVDGSGVSHYNLVDAELLVRVLLDMHRREETRSVFRTSLPVGGVDGTLATRFRAQKFAGRVHAKTGTVSGVSALAGYLSASGGEFAFALLMENFVGSAAPWRELQERICGELLELDPAIAGRSVDGPP